MPSLALMECRKETKVSSVFGYKGEGIKEAFISSVFSQNNVQHSMLIISEENIPARLCTVTLKAYCFRPC